MGTANSSARQQNPSSNMRVSSPEQVYSAVGLKAEVRGKSKPRDTSVRLVKGSQSYSGSASKTFSNSRQPPAHLTNNQIATAQPKSDALNFHSLNQEYQIQFNRLNRLMGGESQGMNSASGSVEGISTNFSQQLVQQVSGARSVPRGADGGNVQISKNWRSNISDHHRYSEDYSAARALSQNNINQGPNTISLSTKNTQGGQIVTQNMLMGGNKNRPGIHARINMPSKKGANHKRKKSSQGNITQNSLIMHQSMGGSVSQGGPAQVLSGGNNAIVKTRVHQSLSIKPNLKNIYSTAHSQNPVLRNRGFGTSNDDSGPLS